MSKNEVLLTQKMVYEKYFKDHYKTFDSFHGSVLRISNRKIPHIQNGKFVLIKEADVLAYIKKKEDFEDQKALWIERLDEVHLNGNLQKAANLSGNTYQSLYEAVTISGIGEVVIGRLEEHENEILKLMEE